MTKENKILAKCILMLLDQINGICRNNVSGSLFYAEGCEHTKEIKMYIKELYEEESTLFTIDKWDRVIKILNTREEREKNDNK